jgi:peptidyl-dipeptidase A
MDALEKEVLPESKKPMAEVVSNRRVGQFMQQRVFDPGATLSWNALTRHATGEELNAKSFANDFRGK